MVNIPHLRFLDDDEQEEQAHPLGIRTLRKSGGSIVVTIPPDVMELVNMSVDDDVVIHAASDSITLTKLPEQE